MANFNPFFYENLLKIQLKSVKLFRFSWIVKASKTSRKFFKAMKNDLFNTQKKNFLTKEKKIFISLYDQIKARKLISSNPHPKSEKKEKKYPHKFLPLKIFAVIKKKSGN